MAYTLGEAAKATGISKASISRAINSGRISATKKDDGSFSIEPVELHRVYPPKSAAPVTETPLKRYATAMLTPVTGQIPMYYRLVLMLPWNSCAIGTARSTTFVVASINRMRNGVRLKPE